MRIILVGSEMAPFVKTGGLADVIGALSRELAALGHEVVTFLPLYRAVKEKAAAAQCVSNNIRVPLGGRSVVGAIYELPLAERQRVVFVRQDELFDRAGLYGEADRDYTDNAARYLFFSKAVVASIPALRFVPDVLHAHDWQAAFVPLWWSRTLAPAWRLRTVFTIHNLAYQGMCPREQFELTNLPADYFGVDGLEFYGGVNLLKAGLLYSDVLTTVSRHYAEEIQTKEYGCGLEGLLKSKRAKLHGVLNGADYTAWNPLTDRCIAANYDRRSLANKVVCKRGLLDALGLPVERAWAPLIGMVSRIVEQKGYDLVAEAVPQMVTMGASLAILGKGDAKLEKRLQKLAERFPTRLSLKLGFDEALAHQIEAGADMFLMPSRFEPCGLNQMYSLRYGTVPIVRATGGLADTVQPYHPGAQTGNGFLFDACTPDALLGAVARALETYRQRQHWARVVQNGMACDFSWRKSALQYLSLYQMP
ncbi:MAG: glycogen synthase GlgA [Verrucomicrobia bacterium]|nr:glycogen synthase GlgA [Verrucomicrobiota bacterium]